MIFQDVYAVMVRVIAGEESAPDLESFIETARLHKLAREASILMRNMRLRVGECYDFSPENPFGLPAQYIDPNLELSTSFVLTNRPGPIKNNQVKSYGELAAVVGLQKPKAVAIALPRGKGILTASPETDSLVEATYEESKFVVGILESMLIHKNYREFANSRLTRIFSS